MGENDKNHTENKGGNTNEPRAPARSGAGCSGAETRGSGQGPGSARAGWGARPPSAGAWLRLGAARTAPNPGGGKSAPRVRPTRPAGSQLADAAAPRSPLRVPTAGAPTEARRRTGPPGSTPRSPGALRLLRSQGWDHGTLHGPGRLKSRNRRLELRTAPQPMAVRSPRVARQGAVSGQRRGGDLADRQTRS